MKKKILSTLLAVCLFVGVAVPAVFAGFPSSSQEGTDADITSLKFSAASYDVAKGSDVKLAEKITAFCAKNKITQNPTITWSLESNSDLAFTIDNKGTVNAIEEKGSATVVAKANDDKVVAKVKLVAKPAKTVNATGFIFEKSVYDLPVGTDADNFTFKAVATPEGAKFTADQMIYVKGLTDSFGLLVGATTDPVVPTAGEDDGKITFTFAAAGLIKKLAENKKVELEVKFPKPNAKDTTTEVYESKKVVTFKTVNAVKGSIIGAASSTIDMEVGQELDFAKYFKVGASDANVKNGYTLSVALADDKAAYDDFAVIDGKKVKAIAVGKNKIVATLTADPTKTATILVNVKPAGSIVTTPVGKISAEKAELKVGETTTVSIKDFAKDAKLTWKVSDSAIAQISPFTGDTTRIYAKKAGTVKVTAIVDGVEIGSCTVTVKAADVAKPADPAKPGTSKPSTNPQTGDSLFANLF